MWSSCRKPVVRGKPDMLQRCPPPPPDPLEVELLGELIYCFGCAEWWPADSEFFPFDKRRNKFGSPWMYAAPNSAPISLIELVKAKHPESAGL